jgi:hypothetical protein
MENSSLGIIISFLWLKISHKLNPPTRLRWIYIYTHIHTYIYMYLSLPVFSITISNARIGGHPASVERNFALRQRGHIHRSLAFWHKRRPWNHRWKCHPP